MSGRTPFHSITSSVSREVRLLVVLVAWLSMLSSLLYCCFFFGDLEVDVEHQGGINENDLLFVRLKKTNLRIQIAIDFDQRIIVFSWKQECLWGLAAGAAGSLILGYGMSHYTNASLPWLDSALTGFSLVAQWWQARKYIANWWLWIVVDVIYIGEYVYKHLSLTAGLYAFFVFLAALGLRDWRRALNQQSAGRNPDEELARVEAD